MEFNVLGVMDSVGSKKDPLEKYKKKLHHYQKQEAETLSKIGLIYFKANQSMKAMEKFWEALEIYRKMVYFEGEAHIHDLIGDTYLNDRNTSKALEHYQDSFKIYSYIRSPHKKDLFEKIKDTERAQETMALLREK